MPTRDSHIATRLRPFGSSIFAETTRRAVQHGAVNLAQGFPDFDGPEVAKRAAIAAIEAGHAQYARMIGIPPLNAAIAARWEADGKGRLDPEREVTVTSGCSEAIINSLVGMLDPGDEVIVFEPFFDFYTAGAAMAGATCRFVALHPPREPGQDAFWFDPAELEAAFTPRTRALILNTPHNPTGKVFTREELRLIADLCVRHEVVVISDEVYDRLILEPDRPHVSIATLEGMKDRVITLNSLGKTFSLTGWKIGWAIASPPLTAAVRAAHQFMTFSSATPLQHGAAAIIADPGDTPARTAALYREHRDLLAAALSRAGLTVFPSHSTYFLIADHTPLCLGSGADVITHLIERVGVAAISCAAFHHRVHLGEPLIRFAFCKRRETMDEAIKRLERLRPAR
jgi:aspartate/methionine/tyrosine aminotransferase